MIHRTGNFAFKVLCVTLDIANWPRDNWPDAEAWMVMKVARVCTFVKTSFDKSVNLSKYTIRGTGNFAFKAICLTLDIVNWPRDYWPDAEAWLVMKAAKVCRFVKTCFALSFLFSQRIIRGTGRFAFQVLSTTLDIVNWPRDKWLAAEKRLLG